MLISIIVVTRDRPSDLYGLMDTLNQMVVPDGISAELVLVDNGRTYAAKDVVDARPVRTCEVRHLRHPVQGKSGALNAGLEVCNGAILFFTDDDVRPPSDWVSGMIPHLVSGRWKAAAGGIRIPSPLERNWLTPLHRAYLAECLHQPSDESGDLSLQLVGANMAVVRDVFEAIRGFDTELGPGALGFGDDGLLTLQIRRRGFHIGFAPVYAEHYFDPRRLSRESFLEAARKRGRSAAHIAYHWEHRVIGLASIRLARQRLLLAWRASTREPWPHEGGTADWELSNHFGVAYFEQYLREVGRPRKYPAPESEVSVA